MFIKLLYRYRLYRRYLPVYKKIKSKGYPVYDSGVGFMQCTTIVLTFVGLLFLYLMCTLA